MPRDPRWVLYPDCCPSCGDDAEVLTTAPDGLYYVGDEARCASACGATGRVDVDDEDDDEPGARIVWREVSDGEA